MLATIGIIALLLALILMLAYALEPDFFDERRLSRKLRRIQRRAERAEWERKDFKRSNRRKP